MRKFLFVLALVFALVALPQSAQATDFTLGVGAVYGDEIEEFGIQVNGYFSQPWDVAWLRAGGDFTYYDTPSGVDFWELNANGHYVFTDTLDSRVYGIGGLNYSRIKVSFSIPGVGTGSASDSEIGLNLGLGGELKLGFGDLYGEAKFVISDFDQLVVGVGVRFPLGR